MASKEKAPPRPPAPKPAVRGPAFLAPLTGRFGIIGLVGLPVVVVGFGGVLAAYNWDTWFGGQSVNSIGPNQQSAVWGAAAVVGLGVFLSLFGLLRARAPRAGTAADLEAAPVGAQSEAPPPARVLVPSAPPALVEVPEPEAEPEPAPAPARPAPAVGLAVELDEEEEGEIELPAVAQAAPAAPAPPPPPPTEPTPLPSPARPMPAAPAPTQERDELEDLFGELESEVAKAEEEEVHYECPNCHGIVGESDATCPHCNVVFEG